MSREQAKVVAVAGTNAAERTRLAARIAHSTDRVLVPAHRLESSLDPVGVAVHLVSQVDLPAGAVIDLPAEGTAAELVIGLADGAGDIRLQELIYVIDARAGVSGLFRESTRCGRTGHSSPALRRPLASMAQLELASTLVVVNWEELPTEDLQILLALVHHLCPHGRLRLQERDAVEVPAEAVYDPGVVRPGWAHLLGDCFEAYVTHDRISAWRYECVRPFHPVRLHDLVHELKAPGRFGALVRSIGYCRVATSPNVTGVWNHAGPALSLTPATINENLEHLTDPWAPTGPMSLGQDLAFIGLDLDREQLVTALDNAVLTDAEFLAGPATWRQQLRPFL